MKSITAVKRVLILTQTVMNNEYNEIKGLIGVISDETKISEVMPDINSLTYRGYTVKGFAKNVILKKSLFDT